MTIQDNILYIDVEKLNHKLIINNKKSKNLKILWGIIKDDEFENTLESIKFASEEDQIKLKNYVKSIFEENDF